MDKIATEEAVWQVCDQILAEGRKISGRAVKKELGGSSTTIYPYIDSWRARDDKSTVVCEIPTDVQKAIVLALDQSARKATGALSTKIEEAAEREKELLEDLSESEKLNVILENDLAAVQAKISSFLQQRDTESAVTAETIVGLREQISKLDHENKELTLSRETAKTETAKIQLQLDRADQATAKAEGNSRELENQVSTLAKAKSEAETGNAVAERYALDLSGQIAKLDERLKNTGSAIVRFESEKTELTHELNVAMSSCRKAEGTAEQMAFRIQDFAATNEQLRKDLETSRAESALDAKQSTLRIHEAETTIQQLRKEIDSARKEPLEFTNLPSVEIIIEGASTESTQQLEFL